MFENMSGFVGYAMHEDRLARATRNLRVAEAESGTQRQRQSVGATYRAAVAKTLIAVATRIAPTVTVSGPSTRALAQ